jgi:hypothetical protein
MKKFISLLLIIMLSLSMFASTCIAAEKIPDDVQKLINKYNLKRLSKVPSGSKQYKTTTEADAALKKLNSKTKNSGIPRALSPKILPLRAAASSKIYTTYCLFQTPILNMKMAIQYTTAQNKKNERIFNDIVDIYSYVPGPCIGVKWKHTGYDYLIEYDRKSVYVFAYAVMEVSFSVKNVPVAYTAEVTLRDIIKNP